MLGGAVEDYDTLALTAMLDLLAEAAGLLDHSRKKAPRGSTLTLSAGSVAVSAFIMASTFARAEAANRQFHRNVPSAVALGSLLASRGLEGITVESGVATRVLDLASGPDSGGPEFGPLPVLGILIAAGVLFLCTVCACQWLRANPPRERDILLILRGDYKIFKTNKGVQQRLINKVADLGGIASERIRIRTIRGGSIVVILRISDPVMHPAIEDGYSLAPSDVVHKQLLSINSVELGQAIGYRVIVHRDCTRRDSAGTPIGRMVYLLNWLSLSDATLSILRAGMLLCRFIMRALAAVARLCIECCVFHRARCSTGSTNNAGARVSQSHLGQYLGHYQRPKVLPKVEPKWLTKSLIATRVADAILADAIPIVRVGDRVRRGPDWKWGEQDGNGLGTAMPDNTPGWMKVRWDAGGIIYSYRVGKGGCYDLLTIAHPPEWRDARGLARLDAEEQARFAADMERRGALVIAKAQADYERIAAAEAERLAVLEQDILAARARRQRHPGDPVQGPVRDTSRLVSFEVELSTSGFILAIIRPGPGLKRRSAAAIKLQAVARGNRAEEKKKLLAAEQGKSAAEKANRVVAATIVQSRLRCNVAKKKKHFLAVEATLMEEERVMRNDAAITIQSKNRAATAKKFIALLKRLEAKAKAVGPLYVVALTLAAGDVGAKVVIKAVPLSGKQKLAQRVLVRQLCPHSRRMNPHLFPLLLMRLLPLCRWRRKSKLLRRISSARRRMLRQRCFKTRSVATRPRLRHPFASERRPSLRKLQQTFKGSCESFRPRVRSSSSRRRGWRTELQRQLKLKCVDGWRGRRRASVPSRGLSRWTRPALLCSCSPAFSMANEIASRRPRREWRARRLP